MKQIGPVFIEDELPLNGHFIERRTVRAVVLNDQHQVLMLYSKAFDDYTFPGGGIKFMEDHKVALSRELHEELGASGIEIIKPIGYTIEKRFGLSGSGQVYLQSSTYYLTKIHQFGATSFVGREQEHGLESRWIFPEVAIRHNQQVKNDIKHQNPGLRTVLPREEAVLEHIKEIINESI